MRQASASSARPLKRRTGRRPSAGTTPPAAPWRRRGDQLGAVGLGERCAVARRSRRRRTRRRAGPQRATSCSRGAGRGRRRRRRRSARRRAAVSSPGSPGPAPTKATRPGGPARRVRLCCRLVLRAGARGGHETRSVECWWLDRSAVLVVLLAVELGWGAAGASRGRAAPSASSSAARARPSCSAGRPGRDASGARSTSRPARRHARSDSSSAAVARARRPRRARRPARCSRPRARRAAPARRSTAARVSASSSGGERRRPASVSVGAALDGERALARRRAASAAGRGPRWPRRARPSRSRPARASTTASSAPSATSRSRVSTLPRTGSTSRPRPSASELRGAARRAGADDASRRAARRG